MRRDLTRSLGRPGSSLDFGFFDPFKAMKEDKPLDEEEVVVAEEDAGKEQDNGANV